jgi:hypothetical protein
MKKLFCSQYEDVECCETCHSDDSFFSTPYKNFTIFHCCSSLINIVEDIKKHEEPALETKRD